MAEKKLKKLSKKRSSSKPKGIKDQANQIWLAGLGAFARAQEEGGKIFETLVKEGLELESKGRKVTTAKVNEVRGAVEGTVGQVQARATASWDKLEKVFEERVARALGSMGVPTASDIQELTARVEELQQAVDQYRGDAGGKTAAKKPKAKPKAKKAAKKTASKKTKAKKAAPKKAASKPVAKKTTAKKAASKKKLKKKTTSR